MTLGWRPAATGVLLVSALITAGPGSASARARPAATASTNVLTGVAATTPAHAWAVGTTEIGLQPVHTLITAWNGRIWQRVPSPNAPGVRTSSYLNAVAATSRSDAWAVGESNIRNISTLIEHWNGKKWKLVPSPGASKGGNFLNAVSARSVDDVWAVGYVFTGPGSDSRTLIEHWNGKSWVRVPSPSYAKAQNFLNSVVAISADNAWAVGNYFAYIGGYEDRLSLIEHWNGKKWAIAPSPNPGGLANPDFMNGIVAISPADLFAVGGLGDFFAPTATMVLRWRGAKWQRVPSPTNDTDAEDLMAASAVSASDVWAVGSYENGASSNNPPLILHWNGSKWRAVRTRLPRGTDTVNLVSVASGSAKAAWAVGSSESASGNQKPLMMHWNGTRWTVLALPRL